MAYASIAQAEHSPSLAEISSPPLSLGLDFGRHGDPSTESQGRPRVASILKSLSSNQSYEMVEDDDYEEPMRTPVGLALNMNATSSYSPPRDDVAFRSPDPPMRTASIGRHLPLNHPTPDLQALQGALVKNVERLEESAERLSMTSSLEDELHKMRQDQKRIERQSSAPATLDHALRPVPQRQYSAGSWSNSIIGVNQAARTGGYSPSGYITSPTGSIHSNPWSNPHALERHSSKGSCRDPSLPEPLLEGRPLELASPPRSAVIVYNQGVTVASPEAVQETEKTDRPTTSASNDTFHQAEAAFNDFDGVHYNTSISHSRDDSFSRRISLKQPPLARDSKAYREAQPGEKMIYYPAPVPVMLNLPQRLSKANFGEKERRRLQGLSGVPDEMRKSAPWLADQDVSKLHASKQSLNLPPQLRASAFFEQPGVTQNLQLKNGSAIQTLDSILDAAAYAPVSAFTDHPIAGQLGKEVYGSNSSPRKSMQLQDDKAKKRKSSLSNMLKTKRSLSASRLGRTKSRDSKDLLDADERASGDELDRAAAASIAPDDDEVSEEAIDDDDEDQPRGFNAAPTTLLAELQIRKEQQKLRNRTAADAFPNGMHSTLLELDAVTQLQQKARKTKHVTLAWEDHDEASRQNFVDDDVPLGVLFPEKDRANHFNVHKPVGLLERREMEDNEPLSQRRARLRGEPLQLPKSEAKSQVDESSRAPVIDEIHGMAQSPVTEQEDETMAQRAARIKKEKEKGTGGQFAEELTSELGLGVPQAPEPSKTPDAEETLGQRRKRLQEEALKNGGATTSTSQLRSMHSLADILQSHPVGVQQRQVSNESKGPTLQRAQTQDPLLSFNASEFPNTSSWNSARQNSVFANGAYGNFYQQNSPYMNAAFNATTPAMYGAPMPMYMQHQIAGPGYGYMAGYGSQPYVQDPLSGPPLDPKQRQKIDLWRQSIAP
ncbi:uncharacterized protein A1O9_05656 [Exophiala aquamarina CBS 119918]|uniref:Uncharacterized protein n=1 Tax=Exophiala aquamarina CBS 119918 TaxID=1182545 RepID=A0A072PD27_9EURO|nr:uncharacterized protein A1O9_05656 [Exophiala aquamarina CBS 119918]KEF57736.1 hypothetical protein A1O9_05656 [Exophiala aquamarina CBS 119918]